MDQQHENANLLSLSVDIFNCLLLGSYFFLTILNPDRIPNWRSHASDILLILMVYIFLVYLLRLISWHSLYTYLHIILVIGLFSFVFQVVGPLQHILFANWLDAYLISIENYLYGSELSLLLQQITHPVLTEWMMFAYVIYVPLIPAVALICYFSAGKIAAESYLLTFALTNALCYFGFILFPVATPLFYMPEAYHVPLDGWVFTWCGEWIRATQHYPGGGLPSPHTAASTVMLLYLYRYKRSIFYIVLPIVLSIYIATVYGRYHYIWDAILGILTAFVAYRTGFYFVRIISSLQLIGKKVPELDSSYQS